MGLASHDELKDKRWENELNVTWIQIVVKPEMKSLLNDKEFHIK